MPNLLIEGILFLLVFSAPLFARVPGDEVRCDYQNRQACFKEGCKTVNVPGSYLLVPSLPVLTSAARLPAGGQVEIRLCDSEGCTPVAMHVEFGGAFLYLTQANGGTQYMKLYVLPQQEPLHGYTRGDFAEEESVGLSMVVSFGHCPFST